MKLHVVYGTAVLLLLFAIVYLIYHSIDAAISLSYRDQQVHELEEANKQLMSALPSLAHGMSKAEIVAAMKGDRNESSFEKDGCTWVGSVGLKFSSDEKLVHVSPGVSYGELDPCFPR
jgi:hypothetical protein